MVLLVTRKDIYRCEKCGHLAHHGGICRACGKGELIKRKRREPEMEFRIRSV